MKAKIKRLQPDIELPRYQTSESAGFDIAAAEQKLIKPGQVALVRTGLVIQAPEGYFLMLTARSSLALKKGVLLSNGVGTIDRDYCGPEDEIKIQLYNFGSQDIIIEKGERLVNGLFLPVKQAQWEESADQIKEQSRGGHGSTGGYVEPAQDPVKIAGNATALEA